MSTVAAIQMTSGHRVEDNLEAAGKLLREAKDAGAELACLPENFSFIGLKDADKLARSRSRWLRARAAFLERDGARAWALDPRWHHRHQGRLGTARFERITAVRCPG